MSGVIRTGSGQGLWRQSFVNISTLMPKMGYLMYLLYKSPGLNMAPSYFWDHMVYSKMNKFLPIVQKSWYKMTSTAMTCYLCLPTFGKTCYSWKQLRFWCFVCGSVRKPYSRNKKVGMVKFYHITEQMCGDIPKQFPLLQQLWTLIYIQTLHKVITCPRPYLSTMFLYWLKYSVLMAIIYRQI